MADAMKWTRTEKSRDLDIWETSGKAIHAELERHRPARYHGNGVSGLVVDMDAAPSWTLDVYRSDTCEVLDTIKLDDGLSFREAKSQAAPMLQAWEEQVART